MGIYIGLLIVALLVPPVAAAAVRAPGAFRLRASNGFRVTVLAGAGRGGNPGVALISVSRADEGVAYAVPATVDAESIEADLGRVGRIDVRYVADGGTVDEGTSCAEGVIEYDSGFYEGTIELHGEEGYMELAATRARGTAGPLLRLVCGEEKINEGFGGHLPGALLAARRAFAGGRVELEARINSPTRPSRFNASVFETRDRVQIERSVRAVGSSADFRYDVPSRQATIAPPSPFAGAGWYQRPGAGPGDLLGNLSVDFPGRSDVRIAGPRTRANLERYVDNPSHPFRPAASVAAWPSTKP